MAFQSMLSGAECSTSSNTLSQFLKHAQTDRSLQQDGMRPADGAGAPRAQFRTRPAGAGPAPEMEAFAQPRAGAPAFDMHAMRAEMEAMRGAGAPVAHAGAPPSAWAHEMQRPAAASATAWADAARRPSRPGARSTRVRTTWAAMSSGRTPDSAPPTLPKGVRTASNT